MNDDRLKKLTDRVNKIKDNQDKSRKEISKFFCDSGINVVSLFNGHSGGNMSFDEAGIKYNNYFSSEVDKHCLKMEKFLYPKNTQMGDVRNVYYKDGYLTTDNGVFRVGSIGALIGGSPCQSFSFAGKRNGMTTLEKIEVTTLDQYLILKDEKFEFEGYSYLFWEYMRILKEIKVDNPNVFFMLENVKMDKNWNIVINDSTGVEPVLINSNLLSAQNRKRLYWTNIPGKELTLFGNKISQPKNKNLRLADILEKNVNKKYYMSGEKANKLLKDFNDKDYKINKGHRLNIAGNTSITNHGGEDIYNPNGLARTLLARDYKDPIRIIKACAIRGRNPENPKSRVSGLPTQQILEVSKTPDTSNCLTTVQKDTMVLEFNSFKIRKLTPREYGRLQTIPDNIIDKMLCAGVSETQLYKMFGNGWTIDVIAHILQGVKF